MSRGVRRWRNCAPPLHPGSRSTASRAGASAAAVGASAVALALGACGGGNDSAALPSGEEAAQPAAPAMSVAADAQRVAQWTTPFQAEILRDGRVTWPEYRASTDAAVRCLRSAPFPIRVDRPQPAPGRELHFGWSVKSKGKAQRARREKAVSRLWEKCHATYEREVKLVYANQRVIPAARRPQVYVRLLACLGKAGLRTGARPTMDELKKTLEAELHHADPSKPTAVDRCLDRYADFFRKPAPLPEAPSPSPQQ